MKRNIRSLFVHVQPVELLERVIARGAYIIDVYGVWCIEFIRISRTIWWWWPWWRSWWKWTIAWRRHRHILGRHCTGLWHRIWGRTWISRHPLHIIRFVWAPRWIGWHRRIGVWSCHTSEIEHRFFRLFFAAIIVLGAHPTTLLRCIVLRIPIRWSFIRGTVCSGSFKIDRKVNLKIYNYKYLIKCPLY